MTVPRVLYIVHNHPDLSPGGTELYTLELYKAMRADGEFEPVLLARCGPGPGAKGWPHLGVRLTRVNDDPNQYLLFTDPHEIDYFYGSGRDKLLYTRHFRDFLSTFRPDVVHFQHTVHLGFDLIRMARKTLPEVSIVYTLHEFLPICARDGQMVTTQGNELCHSSSPRSCARCFPERSPADFFMRKRFIQSHLELVDLFVTPSEFLRQRYIEWGIPGEKIVFEENGRRLPAVAFEPRSGQERGRFGFFGQMGPYKGLHVLLRAMQALIEEGMPAGAHLSVYGGGLDQAPDEFQQRTRELLEATKSHVSFFGRYAPSELSMLMREIDWVVVPSIWWENSPLVIQEAFHYGRPIICSNIGGMAEKVNHGVNGLHFRVGDPLSLASRLRQAATTNGLWESLRQGIRPVYRIEEAAKRMAALYGELIATRARRHAVGIVSSSM